MPFKPVMIETTLFPALRLMNSKLVNTSGEALVAIPPPQILGASVPEIPPDASIVMPVPAPVRLTVSSSAPPSIVMANGGFAPIVTVSIPAPASIDRLSMSVVSTVAKLRSEPMIPTVAAPPRLIVNEFGLPSPL